MYTPVGESFGLVDSLIVALIATLIVFVVLLIIIVVANIFSKVIVKLDNKKNINPRIENKILAEDEDAVVATLVASIDFYNETKKNARLVSITKEEE